MDGFFSFAEAWNQTGLLIGALIMIGLGGAMVAYWFYMRKTATRCPAKIVGVREASSKNGASMYYPVVEYFSRELGETIQAETDVGSSSLKGKDPGTSVVIYAMPGKPHKVSIEGKLLLIIGSILMIPGFIMGYIAVTEYSFSIWSVLLPMALVGVLAMKIVPKAMKAGGFGRAQASKYALSNEADGAESPEKPGITGLKDIGSSLLAGAEQKRSNKEKKGEMLDEAAFARKKRDRAKQTRKFAPLGGLVGIVLLGVGIWLTQDLMHMLEVGKRTQGEVVRLEESYSSSSSGGSSYTYYPIVEYVIEETGKTFEFKDSIGSNPPAYDRGEAVTVLYDPDNPQSEVMIDRGIWNWLAPGLCTGFGVLILLISINSWAGARRQAERV